ncbi:MAG: Fic family protein [Desulfosarcina sp.]|nr:Fic family protein [Desulfobacterales bacterium]
MKRTCTGEYFITKTPGEKVKAFIPLPLPPKPPIHISDKLLALLEKASLTIGKLDSLSMNMPDSSIILYQYIRKEAVLSSQIEGTQSSLSDLLKFENDALPGVPLDDVQEVSSYVAAINYGLKRIRSDNFPVSIRLLKEIHKILLSSGRGAHKNPGEFRKSQNWIGGTRPGNAVFVPAPPHKVLECMGNLEKFIHDESYYMPVLFKAAIAHVQFETIHPFLDGNGRAGRLFITLYLCSEKILHEPVLYLSLYLKKYQKEYYDLLQEVRLNGNWEKWIMFFLEGVCETAGWAVETAKAIKKLYDKDSEIISAAGKSAGSLIRTHQHLMKKLIVTPTRIAKELQMSFPTVQRALQRLEQLEIIREITGRKRNKMYAYEKVLAVLERGVGTNLF